MVTVACEYTSLGQRARQHLLRTECLKRIRCSPISSPAWHSTRAQAAATARQQPHKQQQQQQRQRQQPAATHNSSTQHIHTNGDRSNSEQNTGHSRSTQTATATTAATDNAIAKQRKHQQYHPNGNVRQQKQNGNSKTEKAQNPLFALITHYSHRDGHKSTQAHC